MQRTSLEAYEEIKKTMGKRQAAVFGALNRPGLALTNAELARYLNWPINTVTPRTNELVNVKRLVVEAHKRRCSVTNRTAIAWRLRYSYEGDRQMEMAI